MKTIMGLVIGAALLVSPSLVQGQSCVVVSTAGSVTLRAQITAQGRVTLGNGIGSVGIKGPGLYRVTLNHSATACTFNVNIAGTAPGYATIAFTAKDSTATKVDVTTFDQTGAPTNLPFFFTAQCAS